MSSLFFLNVICEKSQTKIKRKTHKFSPVADVDFEQSCFLNAELEILYQQSLIFLNGTLVALLKGQKIK